MDITQEEILLFKSLKKDAINRIKRSYPSLRNYIINISDINFSCDYFASAPRYFYSFFIKITPISDAKNAFKKEIGLDFDLVVNKYFTKKEVFTRVLTVELDEIRKQLGENK